MGEIAARRELELEVFGYCDADDKGELTVEEIQALHGEIRLGGISFAQTRAAICYTCIGARVEPNELCDVLKEMDRRYFLIQDFRWEFSMLDVRQTDTIPEDKAKWFMQAVHGDFFSKRRWEKFLHNRAVPGSGVTFAEIEVDLCNVSNREELAQEEAEEERQREERSKRKMEKVKAEAAEREQLRLRMEEANRKRREDERQRQEDEERRRKEEEEEMLRKKQEKEEEEQRIRRLRDEEIRGAQEAAEREHQLQEEREEEEEKRKRRALEQHAEEKLKLEQQAKQKLLAEKIERERLEEVEGLKKDILEQNSPKINALVQTRKIESEATKLEDKEEELEEIRRLRELGEKEAKEEEERQRREVQDAEDAEAKILESHEEEKAALEEIRLAQEDIRNAKDAKNRHEAEEREKAAKARAAESNNKIIRYNLKAAISSRNKQRLESSVSEFKKAKLPDDDGDLFKAERLIKQLKAKDKLMTAIDRRMLKELESAMDHVKKNGFEPALAHEMVEANKLLLQLRRLERIRAEILELKQSTVAEIRSYQKPPPVVHTVMIGTFLLLGHKEKETKDWKAVQALVGKTGKESLKRRCLELDAGKLDLNFARKAKMYFNQFDLEQVRDVSAGAATFYVWGTSMIEEAEIRSEANKKAAQN